MAEPSNHLDERFWNRLLKAIEEGTGRVGDRLAIAGLAGAEGQYDFAAASCVEVVGVL